MELRPYQSEAIQKIQEQWESGTNRTLLVLPTGCGKTIVFCKLTEQLVGKGNRVLIMAHRGELLDQAADKLLKSTGLRCAVEKAEESCLGSWFRVVVGSVQTLMREKRLEQFEPDYFDTIIVDEAHHCLSDSYQRVLEHFSGAKVLGVTATPDRGDMRNLGQYFESLAYQPVPKKDCTSTFCMDCTGREGCELGCKEWREWFVKNWNKNICRKPKAPERPLPRLAFRYEHPDMVKRGACV